MKGFKRGIAALNEITAGTLPASVYFGAHKQTAQRAQARGDSGEALYGEEALTAIQTTVYEAPFKPHPFLDLISYDTSGGAGLQSSKYYEGEARAKFNKMGSKSAGFDTADVSALPILQNVEVWVSGWEMWLTDTERAARAMTNPVPRKARACRSAYRALLLDHCLYGDNESQIEGLLTTGRIKNRASLATPLTEASNATELYSGLTAITKSIPDTSEGLHDTPYALAVPGPLKRHCDTTFRGSESTVSVTDWFQGSTGYQLISIESLKSVQGSLFGEAGVTSAAIAGNFGDPDTIELFHPRPLFQLPTHIDNAGMRAITPVITDIGGWHIYDPTALAVRTNIWSS